MTLCTRTTPEPGCAYHIPARLAPERSPGVVVLPGPTLDEGIAAMLGEHAITPAAAEGEAAQPGHQAGAAWGVAPTAEAVPHIAASAVAPDDEPDEPLRPSVIFAWLGFAALGWAVVGGLGYLAWFVIDRATS